MFEIILALFILLIGFAMLIGGSSGVNWLFDSILAPIRWILRIAIWVTVLGLLGWWGIGSLSGRVVEGFRGAVPAWLWKVVSESPTPIPPTLPPTPKGVLLPYPALGQRDFAIYSPSSLADEIEHPEGESVKKLACLATVNLMLERGRGNTQAMLDRSRWVSGLGAVRLPYVDRVSSALEAEIIFSELQAGRPVIIEAPERGGRSRHFMLVVGWRPGMSDTMEFLLNDPWRGHVISLIPEISRIHDPGDGRDYVLMYRVSN